MTFAEALDRTARAQWGTSRARVANMVEGVSEGYSKNLELVGVGYRAQMQGRDLKLALGFSHDVIYKAPEGIDIKVAKPTEIAISGIDKQAVGQVAAEIRNFRPPEPYKRQGRSLCRRVCPSQGRQEEVDPMSTSRDKIKKRTQRTRRRLKALANGRPRLSVAPFAQEHFRPDHR